MTPQVGRSPHLDVLAAIDQVVAEHESCGCGCGLRLTDASPSPFFASQECQERWMWGRSKPLPSGDAAAAALLAADPPPAWRERLEAAEIARLRAELGPPRPRMERRVPVVEQPCAGRVVVPFIGGPWHSDLRAILTPLPDTLRMVPPTTINWWDESPVVALEEVLYTRRRMVSPWWREHRTPFDVYTKGQVTDRETHEALGFARDSGWRP